MALDDDDGHGMSTSAERLLEPSTRQMCCDHGDLLCAQSRASMSFSGVTFQFLVGSLQTLSIGRWDERHVSDEFTRHQDKAEVSNCCEEDEIITRNLRSAG